MVDVPLATPVTTPVEEIVAIAVFPLDHVPPLVVLEILIVPPAQIAPEPTIELGRAFTVTVVYVAPPETE
jgi:hypothetical protein